MTIEAIQNQVCKLIKTGYNVIRVESGTKGGAPKGWVTAPPITLEQVPAVFNNLYNVAVRLGVSSSNIIDVDVDDPRALPFAARFLPKTGRVYGRASKPESHYHYQLTDGGSFKSLKIVDVGGKCVIEIRGGDNHMSLVPPSTHPEGEIYVYGEEGKPSQIEVSVLLPWVNFVGACTMLTNAWPEKGSRHELALAVAGWFGRAGFSEGDIEEAIYLAAKQGGDEEAVLRKQVVKPTLAKIKAGEPVTSLSKICEILGKEAGDRLEKLIPNGDLSHEAKMFKKLNDKFALAKVSQDVLILDTSGRNQYGQIEVGYLKKAGLRDLYANELIRIYDESNKVRLVNPIDLWLQHPKRRTYTKIAFSPNETLPAGQLNLFSGFTCIPKEGSCEPFLEFILGVICNGRIETYTFLIAHLAKMIQKPGEKNGVAVVMYGEKGIGKSFFTQKLAALLGAYATKVEDPTLVFGSFNGHLETTIMLIIEEMSWMSNDKSDGKLKELITGENFQIHHKFRAPYSARNYMHVFINTNSKRAIPASPGERRYLVLDVSPQHKKDTAYFAKLEEWFAQGGKEALLHYLQDYDYSGVNLRIAPSTNALWDQMFSGLEIIEKWIYEALDRGYFDPDIGVWQPIIPKNELFSLCISQLKAGGNHVKSMQSKLGKKLKSIFPGLSDKKITEGFSPFGFQTGTRAYVFPSLMECRKQFEEYVGLEVSWQSPIE